MAVDMTSPQQLLAPALFPVRPPSRTLVRPSSLDDPFFYKPRPRSHRGTNLPLYRLPEDVGPHKLSKPPCSPTKRRRGVSRNLSRSARNRHCARSDCCINTICRPLTSLDDLPWISALTIEPDSTNPWDIADLSLLDTAIVEEKPSSGPGPVRRRKTSLRLDPLAHPEDDHPSREMPFPFIGRTLFQEGVVPHTPAPRNRFDPSDVFFHRLHPILPSDIEASSRSTDSDASR